MKSQQNKILVGLGLTAAAGLAWFIFKKDNDSNAGYANSPTSNSNPAGWKPPVTELTSSPFTFSSNFDASKIVNNRKNRSSAQLGEVAGDLQDLYKTYGKTNLSGDSLIAALQEFLNTEQIMTSQQAWDIVFKKFGLRLADMPETTKIYLTDHYGLNGPRFKNALNGSMQLLSY
jgi:hypothetical protein